MASSSILGIDDVVPFPAPLPSRDPTLSYWLATSPLDPRPPLAPTASTPTLPSHAHVVIIGSGITGTSLAYHLSQHLAQNTSIVLLEARDFCSGATGRNGGLLTPVSALSYSDLASNPAHLHRFSPTSSTSDLVKQILEFEHNVVDRLLAIIDTDAPDIELTNGDNWHLCFSQTEVDRFEKSIAEANHAGLHTFTARVRRVEREEIDRTLHNPNGILAAYQIPGHTLHPRKLVSLLYRRAAAEAAKRNISLQLFTHSPVTRTEQRKGPIHRAVVHVGAHTINARYVVHATNGYVSHLAQQLAGPSGVVPTRAQVVAVEPSPSDPFQAARSDGWSVISSSYAKPKPRTLWSMGLSAGEGYEYGHQRPVLPRSASASPLAKLQHPPVIFGGGRQVAPGREWGVADDGTTNPVVSKFLHAWLPRSLPSDFGHSRVVLEWTGIMGYTKSQDPIVGPLPDPSGAEGQVVPGQFVSAGYSGHGMSRAFLCAQVVAGMIVAEERGSPFHTPDWFPSCYLSAVPK